MKTKKTALLWTSAVASMGLALFYHSPSLMAGSSAKTHPAVWLEGSEEAKPWYSSLHPDTWFQTAATPPPLTLKSGRPAVFDREFVLNDGGERISELFQIPEGMKDRVGFWFDVYTKYDSNQRVIHLADQPWIIFEVVDVAPIINASEPRRRWMRNEKADKHVKAQAEKIRAALRALSRPGRKPKTETEILVAEKLSALGGNLNRQARVAAGSVRVQTGQKEHFTEGLRISQRYMGSMEEIFQSHRLPVELARIPFVESSFNKRATSKVGAAGIWQFMNGTGKKFMRVDPMIDERRSPLKATEGAARLLKENHMILHRQWPLAVTAWNHGPPGVRRAIKATGSKDISVIVSKYRSKSFDFASSNFYAEFLAALHAERYSREIYGDVIREDEIQIVFMRVPRKISIRQAIEISGLSADEFHRLNADLSSAIKRRGQIPAGYRLHVPVTTQAAFEQLFFGKKTASRETL